MKDKNTIEYKAISNCPKCHGALFYFEDPLLFRNQKTIKCYNCGTIFLEIKEVTNGKRVILVRAITPLGDRVKDSKNRLVIQIKQLSPDNTDNKI